MCLELTGLITELSIFYQASQNLDFKRSSNRYGDYEYTLLKYKNSVRFNCCGLDKNTVFYLSIFHDNTNEYNCCIQMLSNSSYLNVYNNFSSNEIQSKFNLSFPVCEEEYVQMQFLLNSTIWAGYSTLVETRDLNFHYDLSIAIDNPIKSHELLSALRNLVGKYYA